MANLNIKIPALPTSYYTAIQVPQVKDKLNAIMSKYGNLIAAMSNTCKIPADLIASFVFIESEGKEAVVSSGGAIGLMQVNPQTASDVIFMEKSKGRLSAVESAILRKHIGARLDCIFKMKWMGHKLPCNNNTGISITREDLFNPEFNLLVGCMYLGILIDKYTENGTVRLDKVVWAYNRGYFSKMPAGNVNALLAAAPTETKNYVLKLIGKNSTLDILTA